MLGSASLSWGFKTEATPGHRELARKDEFCRDANPRAEPSTGGHAGLSEILLGTKDLKCTDNRGRLHGVMLLANNIAEGDIDADYSLSAAKTFMKVPQY
jgi:hypothetical protein